MNISGKTRIYGIIGSPVAHSLSPVFQAYFAEQCAIDAVYVPFPAEPKNLGSALDGLRDVSVQGLNITVPFKEMVLPYVSMDDDVRNIGAANTLILEDNQWQASNTDWQGVYAVMLGTSLPLKGAQLLVFGAGGTARSVIHAAAAIGFAHVWVCNRSSERGEILCEHAMKQYPQMMCQSIAWEQGEVSQVCAASCMIVNTTTVGLSTGDSFPFALSGEGWCMDAVYRPDGRTAFVQAAECAHRQAVDGLPMLLAQGAKSFEIWHPEQKLDRLGALYWMTSWLHRSSIRLPAWENVHET